MEGPYSPDELNRRKAASATAPEPRTPATSLRYGPNRLDRAGRVNPSTRGRRNRRKRPLACAAHRAGRHAQHAAAIKPGRHSGRAEHIPPNDHVALAFVARRLRHWPYSAASFVLNVPGGWQAFPRDTRGRIGRTAELVVTRGTTLGWC